MSLLDSLVGLGGMQVPDFFRLQIAHFCPVDLKLDVRTTDRFVMNSIYRI